MSSACRAGVLLFSTMPTASPARLNGKRTAAVAAPLEWIERVADFRLPPETDRRLGELMDRNNEGLLSVDGRAELESLAAMSEEISLIRADALLLLGRTPR